MIILAVSLDMVVYHQSLGEVPLRLLGQAVRRLIRENTYNIVPPPGVVCLVDEAQGLRFIIAGRNFVVENVLTR
jgi:hypothetical protein